MNNPLGALSTRFSRIFVRIPLSEKILFAKHLSMMITSGMTEVEGLRLIRRQVKSRGFGSILDKVLVEVENGQFLSDAMTPFRRVFGDLFINIIKVGEMSGTLAANLNYLSLEMKKSQQLRSNVRSALIYPAVIFAATIGITGVLVFFVLPKILPIFQSLRIKLPLTTRILIQTAAILNQYYLWILAGLVIAVVFWSLLLRIRPARYFLHRLLLGMPLIGKVSVGYNIANMTRTFSILLKSGVKIVEAISITSDIMSNLVYRKELLKAAEEIKKGEALYKYFEKHPSLFPLTASRMIEVGEKTGNLEGNLSYLAEFYENEVDDVLKNLSSTLEPAILVIMGGLVGFIVLSIITPIYEVTQSLTR